MPGVVLLEPLHGAWREEIFKPKVRQSRGPRTDPPTSGHRAKPSVRKKGHRPKGAGSEPDPLVEGEASSSSSAESDTPVEVVLKFTFAFVSIGHDFWLMLLPHIH